MKTSKEIPKMQNCDCNLTKFAQKCISAKVVIFLDCCYSGRTRLSKGNGKIEFAGLFWKRLSLEL